MNWIEWIEWTIKRKMKSKFFRLVVARARAIWFLTLFAVQYIDDRVGARLNFLHETIYAMCSNEH